MIYGSNLYKIDESKPKNLKLLKLIKDKFGDEFRTGVRALARELCVSPALVSLALNKKFVSVKFMIQIAKYFCKDTREIFD